MQNKGITLMTNVEDRDEPNNRKGEVYKIICSDCQASYIGETGRNIEVSHKSFSSAGSLERIHASLGESKRARKNPNKIITVRGL